MKEHWVVKGLGKKNKGGTIIISDLALQSYSNQDSIVLVYRRTRVHWNTTEKPEIDLICVQLTGFSTKAPRVLEKGQSPTVNDAGEGGDLYLEKWNGTSNT